jgi:YD repeat-containing protein
LTQRDGAGGVTTYHYGRKEQLVSVDDPVGTALPSCNDLRYRLVTATDALAGVTTYRYDDGGTSAHRVIDPRMANATDYVYDARRRLVASTEPLGQRVTYTYDGAEQLRLGQGRARPQTTFAYDAMTGASP